MQSVQSLVHANASREEIELWCRQRAQSYPAAAEHVVARVLGKHLMLLPTRDLALTPHLTLSGIWEPWVTMAVARHVRKGMRCLDVGACFGYYALLLADIVGEEGYVEAWEPVWFHDTIRNAQLNGAAIKVIPDAMAAAVGSVVLGMADGNGEFINAGAIGAGGGTDRLGIPCGPPALQPFDFIKIDVEGAEADVWRALAGVRAESPRLTVCMEFTPSKHAKPEAFLEEIQADDFTLGSVGSDGVPRACSVGEALIPDSGDYRMLWLTR